MPKSNKVGIIGAGVGGLYAAMMLDSLGIQYEIVEANDRVGGRLFTYRFTDAKHDYYDVGAMRFPDSPVMKRTFDLFQRLQLPRGSYLWENDNSSLLYNGILRPHTFGNATAYDWKVPNIPEDFAEYNCDTLFDNVVDPFVQAIADDFKNNKNTGWELMMRYDRYSTRAYMSARRNDTRPELDKLGRMPYPTAVVDWLETFEDSTGSFDLGLTESVLDSLAFAFPQEELKWYFIDGGAQTIADAMAATLSNKPILNAPVSAISLEDDIVLENNGRTKLYAHVINTSTLASLRTMDLRDACLDPAQNMALRQLTDGPGTKIGLKLKTAWWKDPRVMTTFGPIVGGQSFTDRMVRTVVYPSYGAGTSLPSTVLIVSYTWAVDAVRWGALLADTSGERLKTIVLRDLAAIHGLDPVEGVAFLREQWVDHFPFSWMNNPHTIGAFGLFGPGQFVQVFENLTRPAAKGRLHFAGESVSVRHGWVVGALDASWRAVRDIVIVSFPELLDDFEEKWGKEADWNDSIAARQFAISMHLQGEKWL